MRTSNDRRVFEKNPDYFMKALPYLDGVVIEITPDASARLSLLRAGKVEFGHMWAWAAVEEGRSLQKTNPEMRLALTPVISQAMTQPGMLPAHRTTVGRGAPLRQRRPGSSGAQFGQVLGPAVTSCPRGQNPGTSPSTTRSHHARMESRHHAWASTSRVRSWSHRRSVPTGRFRRATRGR